VARHPGLQNDERLKRLEEVIRSRLREVYAATSEHEDAFKKYNKARQRMVDAQASLKEAKALHDRLTQVTESAMWPWGLPVHVTIAEYRSVVGNDTGCFMITTADQKAEDEYFERIAEGKRK